MATRQAEAKAAKTEAEAARIEAEAAKIMAEAAKITDTTETDIFQQQKKTIETLYDVMQRQESAPGQPTYVTSIQQSKSAPNYVLWLAIGAGAIWLLKG